MSLNMKVKQNKKIQQILHYQDINAKNKMDSLSMKNVSTISRLSIETLKEGIKPMNTERKRV